MSVIESVKMKFSFFADKKVASLALPINFQAK